MTRPQRQVAAVFVLLLLGAALFVGTAAASVRYAGHVYYTSTQCCGFQEAAFKVFGRDDVRYKVCVVRPDDSTRCKKRRTRGSGVPSRVTFLSNQVGEYTVYWKVSGKVRDTAHYVVNTEGV